MDPLHCLLLLLFFSCCHLGIRVWDYSEFVFVWCVLCSLGSVSSQEFWSEWRLFVACFTRLPSWCVHRERLLALQTRIHVEGHYEGRVCGFHKGYGQWWRETAVGHLLQCWGPEDEAEGLGLGKQRKRRRSASHWPGILADMDWGWLGMPAWVDSYDPGYV